MRKSDVYNAEVVCFRTCGLLSALRSRRWFLAKMIVIPQNIGDLSSIERDTLLPLKSEMSACCMLQGQYSILVTSSACERRRQRSGSRRLWPAEVLCSTLLLSLPHCHSTRGTPSLAGPENTAPLMADLKQVNVGDRPTDTGSD